MIGGYVFTTVKAVALSTLLVACRVCVANHHSEKLLPVIGKDSGSREEWQQYVLNTPMHQAMCVEQEKVECSSM